MKSRRPVRYRDVLYMLKQMARDARVSSDGLRAVLAGNIGDGYTQADIARTHELATSLGWELSVEPEDVERVEFDSPEKYQVEIRHLHSQLRSVRVEVKGLRQALATVNAHSIATGAKRRTQMAAVGVQSVDEAFARLASFLGVPLTENECAPHESAQPCGCDRGANWTCAIHQAEGRS